MRPLCFISGIFLHFGTRERKEGNKTFTLSPPVFVGEETMPRGWGLRLVPTYVNGDHYGHPTFARTRQPLLVWPSALLVWCHVAFGAYAFDSYSEIVSESCVHMAAQGDEFLGSQWFALGYQAGFSDCAPLSCTHLRSLPQLLTSPRPMIQVRVWFLCEGRSRGSFQYVHKPPTVKTMAEFQNPAVFSQ
jgi:hypothetical protein